MGRNHGVTEAVRSDHKGRKRHESLQHDDKKRIGCEDIYLSIAMKCQRPFAADL
jgi:hypothetical protein